MSAARLPSVQPIMSEPASSSRRDSVSLSTARMAPCIDATAVCETSTARRRKARGGEAPLVWPPAEADLDDIHVLDTGDKHVVRSKSAVAPATLNAGPTPSSALVAHPHKSDGVAVHTHERAPVELAIRGFEAQRVTSPNPNRNKRWFTTVATAACGNVVALDTSRLQPCRQRQARALAPSSTRLRALA
jgi:hypothetical protein